jgi:ABC-type phosphate transport system substrate-binding protein
VLVRPGSAEGARAEAFFAWALGSGSGVVADLGYVPLPAEAAAAVLATLRHD